MTSSKVSLIFSTNVITKSMDIQCFGIYLLLASFIVIIKAHQICEPPDIPANGHYSVKQDRFPANGHYSEKQDTFQLGDEITYKCNQGYTLMGKENNKCQRNGDWKNLTPFCDRKVQLIKSIDNVSGRLSSEAIDGDLQNCSILTTSADMSISLSKSGAIFAVRIFLEQGPISIRISVGTEVCNDYKDIIETKRWILLECNKTNVLTDSIKIQNLPQSTRNSKICEVEVYAKEEDGCDKPPSKKVSNGYFEVSRSISKLICKEGYDHKNNSIFVCENNNWMDSNIAECYEILCLPDFERKKELGTEWKVLDYVSKLTLGTRAQIRCESGYKKEGSPEIITCQKDRKWTKTNATCKEVRCDPTFKPTKGPGIEWISLDAFQRASVGSRRQLKCGKGYERVGRPDLIQCEQNGTWTKTNATCKEEKVSNAFMNNSTLIIIIVVGIIVVVIIVALIGTTIYFVKKQRRQEVVVVYNNPPTEGSVVSGSDIEYASGYYESIQESAITPSTISKSTPHQVLRDGYFLPADNKGTLKKLPIMPTDIAFDSLKHCQVYK